MTSTQRPESCRVVIAGGGIAAVEAVLALADAAAERLHVTLIAPRSQFTLRPLDVARPFARSRPGTLDLERLMGERGWTFREARVCGVDAARHLVACDTGPDQPYDALLVALGARAAPAFEHGVTFGADPAVINGLLADLEGGFSQSAAFVVPDGCTWTLPLYELALMTAEQVWASSVDARIDFVTPEHAPLEVFGSPASSAVAVLLQAARITLHAGVHARVPRAGIVELGNGEVLEAQRIVALPVLIGPGLPGLPDDADGFLPVDDHGRVVGVRDVYAAGDVTDHPVKQGGLACQQADAVALHIAAAAGAPVDAAPYTPVMRGRLLTGHGDRFLQRPAANGPGLVACRPLWWPPGKVAGKYLAPYLDDQGLMTVRAHEEAPADSVLAELLQPVPAME